jgi:metal-sulfur cluster biosynthetic enzyme
MPSPPSAAVDPAFDAGVIAALGEVIDPEVGLSIVDLGLVYGARRDQSGIQVALTLTTQACPLGDVIVTDAYAVLMRHFPDAPQIKVALVHEPAWSPERITEQGRQLLGHPPRTTS